MNHVAKEHEPRQCLHCAKPLSKTEYDQHLISTHSYQRCPFCLTLESQLLRYIRDTHLALEAAGDEQPYGRRDPGLADPEEQPATGKRVEQCPECQKPFKKVYEHSRRKHGIKKRSKA